MPRLENSRTGVVVNVSDATAAGMTAEWATPKASAADTEAKPARRKAATS